MVEMPEMTLILICGCRCPRQWPWLQPSNQAGAVGARWRPASWIKAAALVGAAALTVWAAAAASAGKSASLVFVPVGT